LDALIVNTETKGFQDWKIVKLNGVLSILVNLLETDSRVGGYRFSWFCIESTYFNLPKNDQPYAPYTGPLVPYQDMSYKFQFYGL
jgi:hypothetical protein